MVRLRWDGGRGEERVNFGGDERGIYTILAAANF